MKKSTIIWLTLFGAGSISGVLLYTCAWARNEVFFGLFIGLAAITAILVPILRFRGYGRRQKLVTFGSVALIVGGMIMAASYAKYSHEDGKALPLIMSALEGTKINTWTKSTADTIWKGVWRRLSNPLIERSLGRWSSWWVHPL